ncbi:MAG: hypothetical protein IKJ68_10165 [Clostridia bacterium]|nr:hypothetical protein [Clostridia bacterium]
MKQYIKPSVDVVELAVRENIAALPNALVQGTVSTEQIGGQSVTLTTYNLAAQQTSADA